MGAARIFTRAGQLAANTGFVIVCADIFPGGGGVPADVSAIVIAVALFALLYWAIELIDRI